MQSNSEAQRDDRLDVGGNRVLEKSREKKTFRTPYSRESRKKARRLVRSGMSRAKVAEIMEASESTIRQWTKDLPPVSSGRGTVPVQPFQEAFLGSGLTPTEVALRLGWTRVNRDKRYPDGDRVKKALGLRPYQVGRGRGAKLKERLHEDTALEFCRALRLDPWEVGI
jgi:hypothetical protein